MTIMYSAITSQFTLFLTACSSSLDDYKYWSQPFKPVIILMVMLTGLGIVQDYFTQKLSPEYLC